MPKDPRDFTDRYNTPIPPDKQDAFQSWVDRQKKRTGRNPLADKYDYDVQGFFLSNIGKDDRGHGPDTFKKPNHPTFSDESRYHGINGNFGGHWSNIDGRDYYQPSPTNLKYYPPDELSDYFKKIEPDVKLMPTQVQAPPAMQQPQVDMQQQPLLQVFSKILGLR